MANVVNMTYLLSLIILIINLKTFCFATIIEETFNVNDLKARTYLKQLNQKEENWANRLQLAIWAYDSNITDENLQNQVKINEKSKKNQCGNKNV